MKNRPKIIPLRQTETLLQKINESNRLRHRNPVRPLDHDYNSIPRTVIDPEIYRINRIRVEHGPTLKHRQRDSFDLSNARNVINLTSPGHEATFETEHDTYPIVNKENYRMHRLRTYNDESKDIPNVSHGELLTQTEYYKRKQSQNTSLPVNSASPFMNNDESRIYRENLFVTSHKKDIHINTDIDSNQYFTNTGLVSKDAPIWFQTTQKYHVKDFNDEMRKTQQKFSREPTPDILLNPFPIRPQSPNLFRQALPYKGQRYKQDRKVMVLVDKARTKSVPYNDQFTSQGHEWLEKPENQSYDRAKLVPKILMKETKIQDLITRDNFCKVGENLEGKKVNSMRPIQVKIGHPDRVYEIRKKYEQFQ